MLNLRELRWPDDRKRVLALDTSFTTDRIYQVVATARSFALEERPISPPLTKVYPLADEIESLPDFDYVIIAEVDRQMAGLAAMKFETWNRRAVLWHCYLAPPYRGQGIGRALIDAAVQQAQAWHARCLWLETQNVNYPAIQFYRRVGFQLCGLDTTLYDAQEANDDIALFFAYGLGVRS